MRIRIGMLFGFDALARLGRGDIRGGDAAPTESSSVVACPVPGRSGASPRRFSVFGASWARGHSRRGRRSYQYIVGEGVVCIYIYI